MKRDIIIFDLGRVLLGYDWRNYLDSFSYDETAYKAISEAVFKNEDWERGDRGGITSGEWLQLFIENAPEYENQIREVFADLKETIYPMPYTDKWIDLLKKKGYKLYFLSNYSEHLYKETCQHMGFLKKFDGGIFSYAVRCIKPEEKIYRLLLEKYDIDPKRAVFFDDLPKNIEAANRLGIQGILFTPEVAADVFDYPKK